MDFTIRALNFFSLILLISNTSSASGLINAAKQAGKIIENPKVKVNGVAGKAEQVAKQTLEKDRSILHFGDREKMTSKEGYAEIDTKTNKMNVEVKAATTGDILKVGAIDLKKFIFNSETIKEVKPIFFGDHGAMIEIKGTRIDTEGKTLQFTKLIQAEPMRQKGVEGLSRLQLISSKVVDPNSNRSMAVSLYGVNDVRVKIDDGEAIQIPIAKLDRTIDVNADVSKIDPNLAENVVMVHQVANNSTIMSLFKIENGGARILGSPVKDLKNGEFPSAIMSSIKGSQNVADGQAVKNINLSTGHASGDK